MIHLASFIFGGDELPANFGLWVFLSVGAVAMFAVFIPLVTFIESRRKEREAFYRAETFRRIAEASSEGSKAAMELMREEGRQKQIKIIEAFKIAGLINVGVGIALVVFLRVLTGTGSGSPYLCGLIPGLIGVAMLVYAFALARPVDQ
jgi:hypothetical protein